MMDSQENQSRSSKWGWGVLMAISALLILNGVALFFISDNPSTFEQDTGIPMSEVRDMYPTVVNEVVDGGQSISMLLVSLGVLSLMVIWEGFRHQTRWAWNTLWVLFGTLLVVGLKAILLDARSDIGGLYLGLATITLIGELLTRTND